MSLALRTTDAFVARTVLETKRVGVARVRYQQSSIDLDTETGGDGAGELNVVCVVETSASAAGPWAVVTPLATLAAADDAWDVGLLVDALYALGPFVRFTATLTADAAVYAGANDPVAEGELTVDFDR
jgi:hypothetical protein